MHHRQHEWEYYSYYQYPHYWEHQESGGTARPELLASGNARDEPVSRPADIHLRSVREVRGYHVQKSDDQIGHVEDFIVDDDTWKVRYLVVDTSNWWFGKKVLIAPQWASSISWEQNKVHINMPRDAIKNSPAWEALAAINREYEVRLYDYFDRPSRWQGDRLPG